MSRRKPKNLAEAAKRAEVALLDFVEMMDVHAGLPTEAAYLAGQFIGSVKPFFSVAEEKNAREGRPQSNSSG